MPRSERQTEIFKGAVTLNESVTVNGVLNVNTPINPVAAISGLGQVNSGTQFVTVSAAGITSGGGVFVSIVAAGSPSLISSGQDIVLGVNSIVEGISFAVQTGAGTLPSAALPFRWWIIG